MDVRLAHAQINKTNSVKIKMRPQTLNNVRTFVAWFIRPCRCSDPDIIVSEICYKINVTLAEAGVQFKDAWIPAFASMTDRYHHAELNQYFISYFWDATLCFFWSFSASRRLFTIQGDFKNVNHLVDKMKTNLLFYF